MPGRPRVDELLAIEAALIAEPDGQFASIPAYPGSLTGQSRGMPDRETRRIPTYDTALVVPVTQHDARRFVPPSSTRERGPVRVPCSIVAPLRQCVSIALWFTSMMSSASAFRPCSVHARRGRSPVALPPAWPHHRLPVRVSDHGTHLLVLGIVCAVRIAVREQYGFHTNPRASGRQDVPGRRGKSLPIMKSRLPCMKYTGTPVSEFADGAGHLRIWGSDHRPHPGLEQVPEDVKRLGLSRFTGEKGEELLRDVGRSASRCRSEMNSVVMA